LDTAYLRTWITLGAASGLASLAAFVTLIAAGDALPDPLLALLAGGWGILIGISGLGLERLLRVPSPRPAAELGAISLFTGGSIMSVMLIVQQTLVGYLAGYRAEAADDTVTLIVSWLGRGTAPIHLGMDIAWDFFLALAMVGFGTSMLSHPRFGRIWGGLGIAGGVLLLAINLYPFPYTPADVGIPYVYPFLISTWFLLVYGRMLASRDWADDRLAG